MEPTTETSSEYEQPAVQETEKQIVDRVLGLKKLYEEATKDERSEKGEIYSAYMGKMEETIALPYETKESIPKLRTEIAYIKPNIFSGQPEIELEGVGDEDRTIAKILEKIVNYRIQQSIPQAYEKIEAWVHQAVTFGTSVLRVIWRFKTEEQEEQGIDGQPYTYETPVVDEPDLEIPNILDVYYNPTVAEIKDQKCIIFRSVLRIDEVKEDEMYNYVGEDGVPNRTKVTASKSGKTTADSSALDNTDLGSYTDDDMVELYELVDDDRIITITGSGILLRDTPNTYGFINAVKFIYEPNTIPNRFSGLGVGQNTLGLSKSYYKLFNQTLTSVKMTNNPMFLAAKGIKLDKKQAVSKPGGVIEVEAGQRSLNEVLQPLLFPDIKQGAIELLNKFDDEHKRASGASDLLQGSASNETLGQDEMVQANISNRFELIKRRFKQALADVADMIIKMELQNLQSVDAPILRIFPEEFRPQIYQLLVNEAQNVKYNIKVKGDTTVARNKNLESKRLVELFQIGAAFLTDQEKRSFLRRIAEKQGEDNIDEIIMETNPVMEQQEQLQLAQGEMQGQMMAQQPMMGPETGMGMNQEAMNTQ